MKMEKKNNNNELLKQKEEDEGWIVAIMNRILKGGFGERMNE